MTSHHLSGQCISTMRLTSVFGRSTCAAAICTLLCSTGSIAQGQPPHRDREETRPPARAPQQGGVDLRPKFEVNQQLRYTLVLTNSSWGAHPVGRNPATPGQRNRRPAQTPQQARPTDPDARSNVEFGLLLRTRDVTEGIATVDMTLETVKIKIQAQEMEIEFDSTAKGGGQEGGGDMMAMAMQSIVGTTMTLKVDSNGNIKSISGGEGLAAVGQLGAQGAGNAGDLFGNIFTVKGTAGFASVGESWETESVVDSGLLNRFRITTRYTLSRMQGRDAVITMRGRYAIDSEGGGAAPSQGQATIKESNYSGNYIWDTASGSLKEMNSSMTAVAEANVGDETIETRNESVIKVTRRSTSSRDR